jgi:methylated-DNA-[protein]-cysteine S-methyltransferase
MNLSKEPGCMDVIETPIGRLMIYFKKDCLHLVRFANDDSNSDSGSDRKRFTDFNHYFKGKTIKITHKFNLEGTDFQKKVWNEIMNIPYGETKTYEDIAIAIGQPKAYRAVANACKQNPLAILIPCHRVVGKNELGGYNWGIEKKKWLIDFETKNKN